MMKKKKKTRAAAAHLSTTVLLSIKSSMLAHGNYVKLHTLASKIEEKLKYRGKLFFYDVGGGFGCQHVGLASF